MKKFIIRDEDNKEFKVEEIEETKTDKTTDEEPAALSEDEIVALKKLASVADKLISLTTSKDACDEDKDIDVDVTDEDEDEDEDDDKEDIVDTDNDVKKMLKQDSKKSVGSIAKNTKQTDAIEENALAVEDAWAKRYGGKK